MQVENWKDIPGYEGMYQVSDQGRVKSLERYVIQRNRSGTTFSRLIPGNLLKPGRMSSGHLSVVITRAGGSRTIHSLVMAAFVGAVPAGKEIRHIDGDPSNNSLSNLAYGSRSENLIDKAYHGQLKLTIDQVREIRRRRAGKERISVLSKEFGICKSSVHAVVTRRYYKHVE